MGDHDPFCLQAMGIGRGEAMPVTQLEPPPTFPPIENQVQIPPRRFRKTLTI